MNDEPTTTKTPETDDVALDGQTRAAILSVAVVGAIFVAAALAIFDSRTAASVGMGSIVAVANLYALGRVVRGVIDGKNALWGVLGFAKVAVLLGIVALLLAKGITLAIPFVFGFGALPVGIALSSLGGRRAYR